MILENGPDVRFSMALIEVPFDFNPLSINQRGATDSDDFIQKFFGGLAGDEGTIVTKTKVLIGLLTTHAFRSLFSDAICVFTQPGGEKQDAHPIVRGQDQLETNPIQQQWNSIQKRISMSSCQWK